MSTIGADQLDSVLSRGRFSRRHLGSHHREIRAMLETLGYASLEELIAKTVPAEIRSAKPLDLPPAASEEEALAELREIASRNEVRTSYIGMGYHGTNLPTVIQRNILENPGWYTAYTPYQAEISQGRMEALVNFQTMVCDLTGMAIANASMLDEATAAAEAMAMCHDLKGPQGIQGGVSFFVSESCHPQTISLLRTRTEPLGIVLIVGSEDQIPTSGLCGGILQYPATDGAIIDPTSSIEKIHAAGGLAVVASDPLALVLLKPPGEFGADIVVGSSQRFGVPMGYGGPHAAFLAVRDEFKRRLPGRLVGVSRDADGNPAYRLTLQTREQHIRREKATSNICTAQVLLAVIASMFAVYHGPKGLREIAEKIHLHALKLASLLAKNGWSVSNAPFFDTVRVNMTSAESSSLCSRAEKAGINLRFLGDTAVSVSLDETSGSIDGLIELFGKGPGNVVNDPLSWQTPDALRRTSDYLTHPVFNTHHTETEMLRYMRRLEAKDLSLTTSMIPLGSCTMKLNATSEMLPVTWETIGGLHPFVPIEQAKGYQVIFEQLERWLAEITGFHAVSLQPNAGSQGEYAGLLVIRAYHRSRGDMNRIVCLIPVSAHGTNPASAAMVGMEIVGVACDADGNVDVDDLRAKIEIHRDRLSALMVTYPSTHGVFESRIKEICSMIHEAGGQVYMDGANMNAQVGLCSPGDIGADVCHLNLHKTFCIPHGGGGPGVGPIGVAKHLSPFLPGHSVIPTGGSQAVSEVSAAPWGSASICVISWMYLRMMGPDGLAAASAIAILNANYMAKRIESYFPVLYKGANGTVAHECILDLREWKARAGIEVEDVAKRLIDYGFHAPTMSWPVAGTLMIEPTESESKEELDRFCDAMIAIHGELTAIERGELDKADNPLKRAPHTALTVTSDEWNRPYSRAQAAYPVAWLKKHKFWPSVSRVDNVYGDRNIFCSCLPVQED
ncbi:MAG: aminomethyl-transferring glycine dehydrogenase [Verrucomicrobia bacterium]|nr:aminomethyl-transferring glycine dehydrogenase [Verrucomicrobiota bacterium]